MKKFKRPEEKIFKLTKILLVGLLIIVVVQSLPIVILRNFGMKSIEGDYIKVYYDEDDLSGGGEVLKYLERELEGVLKNLEFENKKKIDVYIYKNRSRFYMRKYGLISLIVIKKINGYWYKVDNKGVKVLVVSPNSVNPVTKEKSSDILEVSMHEVVHSVNYSINNKLSYFLDNGVAQFLAKQSHDLVYTVNNNKIPTFEFTKSENQIKFANGGYEYSYLYIKYINNLYNWKSVKKLVEGKSYEEIFNKSEREIYDEWRRYLESYVVK